MSFWLAAIVLLVLALGFVLYRCLPLTRRGSAGEHENYTAQLDDQQAKLNISLFREQQIALDAQRDNGTVGENEHAELIVDAQRRLLQDVNTGVGIGNVAQTSPTQNSANGQWLLVCSAIIILFSSLVLYEQLGAAVEVEIAELLKQRQAEAGQIGAAVITQQLQVALKKGATKRPDNLYYWVLLARIEQELGDFKAAESAYKSALGVAPEDANVHAELAQVLFVRAGNRPTDEIMEHARSALVLDPANSSALSLLGISAFARQDYRTAITHWQAALQNSPPMSSATDALRSGISRAKSLLGEAVSDWSVSFRVSLPAPLMAPADATVFIYLREWQGMPMPLVAQRFRVADLPLTIKFDNTMALSAERIPSGVNQLEVVARIAMSGKRQSSSGDLEGRLGPLKVKTETETLNLEINSRLP